jgi:hypothetical protein
MVRLFLVFSALAASDDAPLGQFDDAVSLLQLSTRRVDDLDRVDESAPPAVDAQRYPVAPKPPMGPDGPWGTPWCKDHRGCTPYCPHGCDGAAYWDAPFPNDRIGIPDISTGRRNNKMNFYVCAPGKDLGVPIGKFQNGLTFTYMQCLGSENATKPPFFQEHDMEWKTTVGPRKPGMVRNGWNGGKYPTKGESMEGFGFEYCPDDCVNDCALFKWGNFHQCGTGDGRNSIQWFYDNTANPHENQNCKADAATYKGVGTESYLWCGERTTTTTPTTTTPAPEPAVEPAGDNADAVGDPHMTTNKGRKYDLQ